MKLADWMKREDLDFTGLVIRIHQRTGHQITAAGLQRIATQGGCRIESAKAIVDTTSGEVAFEDLMPVPRDDEKAQEQNGKGA